MWEIGKLKDRYAIKVNEINIVIMLNEQDAQKLKYELVAIDYKVEFCEDKEAGVYIIGFIE